MIISIGERQRTIRSVELVCPRCGLDRPGAEVVVGRWACAFGIPIVPLGEREPMIMCAECGRMSDRGVLDVPTSAQLTALLRDATMAALVLTVRSAGQAGTATVHAAAYAALRDAGYADDDEAFDDELRDLDVDTAQQRLRRVGHELTAYGKQGFLHRIAAVARSTEPMTAWQHDTLVQIGCDLGMAAPHINGVLAVAATAA